MKRSVVPTALFVEDIESLTIYGQEQFGMAQTNRFLQEVKALENMLLVFPFIGESFERETRRILMRSYWLYYRVDFDRILLLRIVRSEQENVDLEDV